MPPTHTINRGDRIMLFDGTITYFGIDPIALSNIEAVYRDGIWHSYKPNMNGFVKSLFLFIFS